MFLHYDEYQELGGRLDRAAFKIYGYEAERKVDAATHGRVKTATEPVKRCIVRLADIFAKADVAQDKTTSFSNDGVSQSFANVDAADYGRAVDEIIREYLANEEDENGVPLLYLGVD